MSENINQTQAKKYILVMEDDKFYGNIFQTKLTEEGFDVTVATDGEKGLEEASKRKPDLILLDLIMPIKDGFEVLKFLKESATLKDVNIIIISNLGQEDDVNKALAMGAVDYLIKANISLQEAVDKVKKYFNDKA
ncbi:MAG: response regulator [Candidatus Gracilibacteria bacterium]|jgi:DNA-binding response OmpR family regulator